MNTPPPAPGVLIARGVCRHLIDLGFAPLTEFTPTRGLRADVCAIGPKGEIWIVECKSSRADFQADHKWRGYLDWCDAFFFAAGPGCPHEILPPDHGLMAADDYGAEVLRASTTSPLAAARRKVVTRSLARAAALRLRALTDPKPG